MFGIEYLTVGAYQTDGDILCKACGERKGLPVSDSVSVAGIEESFERDGCDCDACGAEIVARPFPDVDKLRDALFDADGFTADVYDLVTFSSGYGVSLAGEESRLPERLVRERPDVLNTLAAYYIEVCRERSGVYFGAWRDGGNVYFDLTEVFYDCEQALEKAERRGQKAIYDYAAGESIFLQPILDAAEVAGIAAYVGKGLSEL